MAEFPRAPHDRRIDELGSTDRIHSLGDAKDYLAAVLEKFGLHQVNIPGFEGIRERLATAEYSAVVNPNRRIRESVVAQAFNRIMDEWNAPKWAPTSTEEVHNLRLGLAKVFLPHIIAHAPTGEVQDAIRPVEAVYLLCLLEFNRRVLLGNKEKGGNSPPTSHPPAHTDGAGLFVPVRPSEEALQKQREYLQARDSFFARHPGIDLTLRMHDLLKSLNVD